jgi:hypothetical protein
MPAHVAGQTLAVTDDARPMVWLPAAGGPTQQARQQVELQHQHDPTEGKDTSCVPSIATHDMIACSEASLLYKVQSCSAAWIPW